MTEEFNVIFEDDKPFPIRFENDGDIDLPVTFGEVVHMGEASPYAGPYTVSPSGDDQTLPTEGLVMTDDLTILGVGNATFTRGNYPEINPAMSIQPSIGMVNMLSARPASFDVVVTQPGYVSEDFTLTTLVKAVSELQLDTKAGETITPTESQQTVDKYQWLTGDIIVDAIPNDYVGSAIEERDSTDLTASGATVTVPAGYYEEAASKTIASGSATTPTRTITAPPVIQVSNNGLITATELAASWITPEVVPGYVAAGTQGQITISGERTRQLDTVAGQTVTPTESEQTAVAAQRFTTGAVKVGAIPSNYVGSAITRRDDTDLSSNTVKVTVPAGYYENAAQIQVPVTDPNIVTDEPWNKDGAYAAITAARSYWNTKRSELSDWMYINGDGPIRPIDSSDQTVSMLRDENGAAVSDCSNLMGLILRGYDYLNSPYHTDYTADARYNPQLVVDQGLYWSDDMFDKQTNASSVNTSDKTADNHYRITTAADYAKYYNAMGRFGAAADWGTPEVGDIAFFVGYVDGQLKWPNRFMGISHIGIMNDPTHFINITDNSGSEYLTVVSTSTRAPDYYARPYYGGLENDKGWLVPQKTNLIPGTWSRVPVGTNVYNGVTFVMDSTGEVTLSGVGDSNSSKGVISPDCPIWLPAGSYHLSGVVNGTGNDLSALHNKFGLRVYDATGLVETGTGISGTTYSADGSTSETRTPVTDIGGGADFTLAQDQLVYINFRYTTNDMTGVSCKAKLVSTSAEPLTSPSYVADNVLYIGG